MIFKQKKPSEDIFQKQESLPTIQNNNTVTNLKVEENTDQNINRILEVIDTQYDYNMFTLKYKDASIEKEFVKYAYDEAWYFGKVFVIQLFIILFQYMSFQTYKLINLNGKYPNYKWAFITTILTQLSPTIHLLLMRRYKKLSLWFTDVNTITVFIGCIELGIIGNPTSVQVDGFVVIIVVLTYLSTVSYSQGTLLLSYLSCVTYIWIRSYNWINDHFRFARFNIFFTTAFAFIYIFSRGFHIRERNRFQQTQQQQKLLQLFHNLIRVYHDGILITQQEQIIFQNKQIEQIFDINEQPEDENPILNFENQDYQRGPVLNKQEKVIHELQQAHPSQSMDMQTSLSLDNDDQKFKNIWEYIIYHKYYISDFISGLIQQNPLDGIYFKYTCQKNNDNQQGKRKRLQVFTQVLQIGSANLILTTIRDMSQWLELEKQKNLSEMKTIAFASAAHEFRNPLNAIVSSLSLLENQFQQQTSNNNSINTSNQGTITIPENTRERHYFQTAKNCSKLMLHLVNDILDFSQLEAKSLILNMTLVSLKSIVEECVNVLIFKAQSKGIDLIVELNEATNLYIRTDKNRLIQILINLISNSIKYTNEGYVKVEAACNRSQKMLCLSVTDTGVGIEDHKIPTLFTPFTKIMTNRNLNNEGVGLGLTISKNITEALGGSLHVSSQVGKGTTFILNLPLDEKFPSRQSSRQFQVSSSSCNFDINDNSYFEHKYNHREFTIKDLNFVRDQIHITINTNQFQERSPENDIVIQMQEDSQINQNLMNSNQRKGYNSSENLSLAQKQLRSGSLSICQCPKILIVDDEPFNLIALQGLLEQFNQIKVIKAFNGFDALKIIKTNQQMKCLNHKSLQMIFLDKQMPGMNGIACAQEIRRIEHEQDLPRKIIILITGDENALRNSDQDVEESQKALFDDVLLKPIDLNNLQLLLMRYFITHQN